MASKWEKVVDKAASVALGRKLIICGRSVKWWGGSGRDWIVARSAMEMRPCLLMSVVRSLAMKKSAPRIGSVTSAI